jgi:hypothetical protein
MSVVKKEE